MIINETQSKKLDLILSAFGDEDYLDISKVIDIEPNKRKANSLIDYLVKRGFITRIGDTEENALPMLLSIDSSADMFLDNGGFAAETVRNSQKNAEVNYQHIIIQSTGNGNVINTGNNSDIDNSNQMNS